ncbi:MAG: formyltetrahydrofolate deformylase [Ignavibacteria bacterium]|nr:formyltetrahydrofolate deformylase [Ignavibacteria bacterium]
MIDKTPLIATLLLSCADRKGLVAEISQFIFQRGGNILNLDEHVEKEENMFFTRVEWDTEEVILSREEFENEFAKLAIEFSADYKIFYNDKKHQAAIFVSKYEHCMQEILWLNSIGDISADIKLIVSNHPDLEPLASQYKIPFHLIPVSHNKQEAEAAELALLKENEVDTVILARYMQVLSDEFVNEYPFKIINIHHSFLPAFVGANPYRQAYEKGVKIIGATSHYVTADLDEGPIIEQGVARISHKDSLKDLIRKGR